MQQRGGKVLPSSWSISPKERNKQEPNKGTLKTNKSLWNKLEIAVLCGVRPATSACLKAGLKTEL